MGRPNCIMRSLHAFTEEGNLLIMQLTENMPYAVGMQMQLHCHGPSHAITDLRERAQHDLALHNGPPDAAIIVSCGARASHFYGEEGVESRVLREVWNRD